MGSFSSWFGSMFRSSNFVSTVISEWEADKAFKGYYASIEAVRLKYYNRDPIGSDSVRKFVDYRAAATVGTNHKIRTKYPDSAKFLDVWATLTSLPRRLIGYARLAEREGRIAFIIYRNSQGFFDFKSLPFWKYKYKIKRDNEMKIVSLTYIDEDEKQITIPGERVVFCNFAGEEDVPETDRYTPPRISYCINGIERVEYALQNWDRIAEIFSKATPVWTVDDDNELNRLSEALQPDPKSPRPGASKLWKIGTGQITKKGILNLVQATLDGVEMIEKLIITRVQKICFLMGVPVFLIFPALMSNRSTAEQMSNDMVFDVALDRKLWSLTLQELYTKILIIHNIVFNRAFSPEGLSVKLPPVSPAEVQGIKDTYYEAVKDKNLSRATYWEMLGEINPNRERVLLAVQNQEETQGVSEELQRLIGEGLSSTATIDEAIDET